MDSLQETRAPPPLLNRGQSADGVTGESASAFYSIACSDNRGPILRTRSLGSKAPTVTAPRALLVGISEPFVGV